MAKKENPKYEGFDTRNYLPRDYQSVPYRFKPLGMRVFEKYSGVPFEVMVAGLFYELRSIGKTAKRLEINEATLARRWLPRLGLFFCNDCSRKTGRLFSDVRRCIPCNSNYCRKTCMEQHPATHWEQTDKMAGPRTNSGTIL